MRFFCLSSLEEYTNVYHACSFSSFRICCLVLHYKRTNDVMLMISDPESTWQYAAATKTTTEKIFHSSLVRGGSSSLKGAYIHMYIYIYICIVRLIHTYNPILSYVHIYIYIYIHAYRRLHLFFARTDTFISRQCVKKSVECRAFLCWLVIFVVYEFIYLYGVIASAWSGYCWLA